MTPNELRKLVQTYRYSDESMSWWTRCPNPIRIHSQVFCAAQHTLWETGEIAMPMSLTSNAG